MEKSARIASQSPCLTGDTIIRTVDGDKPLQELGIETTRVISPDGSWTTIYGVHDQGFQAVYELDTEMDGSIRATGDHRFWAQQDDGIPDWHTVEEMSTSGGNWRIAIADSRWAYVTQVAPQGSERAWDLILGDPHTFIANNFVTRDSQD